MFSAATSQPSDCIAKTAILLPTYLEGGPRRGQRGGLNDRSVVSSSGNARYLPRDNLRILSAHLSVSVYVYIWVGRWWGWAVVCSWEEEEEGASPYMTGNSEDASLRDWQIGCHPLCDLANAAHGKSKGGREGGRVAAGWVSRDAGGAGVRMCRGQ